MAAPPAGCIIAYTSEDGRYDAVRLAAMHLAKNSDADLILYDIDAAPAFVGESPLPTEWSGEGSEKQWPHRLTPDDLERAGRHVIAEQVADARAAGVETFGWLPQKRDSATLADYAAEEGAALILLPARHESPSITERLRGETPDKLTASADVPIAFVGDDGSVEYGAGADEGGRAMAGE